MSDYKDDFDANEWGNIGPDSILDPRWNKRLTQAEKEVRRQRMIKQNADRKADPERYNEWMAKIMASNLGKEMSDETKEKILETKRQNGTLHIPSWNKGISPTESTREKISAFNVGKKLKNSTKKKMGESSHKNKSVHTPEGIFISMAAAGRHYWDNNLTTRSNFASTRMWIREQVINENNKGFYFTNGN